MADKMSKVILPVKTGDTIENKEFDVSGSYLEEVSEPYISRQGKDALVDIELVGGTIAWNQMVPKQTVSDSNKGVDYSSNNDGVWTLEGMPSTTNWFVNLDYVPNVMKYPTNHVYMVDGRSGNDGIGLRLMGYDEFGVTAYNNIAIFKFNTVTSVTYARIQIRNLNGVDIGTITMKPQVFDLTQMFGTTIADYVYSLEQATEGSGIAWLQSYGFFTKDYYAYDAGSLQSVCTSGRKITDSSGNERTYPIDDVQLRGLFKLDTNNKLYCDGDVYKSNGAVTRKYGIVDLGNGFWSKSGNNYFMTSASFAQDMLPKGVGIYVSMNAICTKLKVTSQTALEIENNSISYYSTGPNGGLVAYSTDSYETANDFKTAMSGVYLVYELVTETTETADPYINPQRSVADGTEEFVDGLTRDAMVPVGNNSQYTISSSIPSMCEYVEHATDDIQQTIAPIQTTLVALKAYAVGEQFVYNGLLYEITTAIASGGTITINGNCKLADTVTNQILLLISELNKLKNTTRRSLRNITTDLANLPTAVAEQDLEKYGYTIGDYFIGNSGYTYFLADMNTFRGANNDYAVIDQNHISIVVKTGANSKWNETNDTSTGYSGSVLHSYLSGTVLNNIKSDMIALFGGSTGLEHLLPHKLLWTTAISSWGWSAAAQYISALTEPQVYGTTVWSIDGYQTGEAWKHLELFKKFSFMEILGWIWFWLRSISSASDACSAGNSGGAGTHGASISGGVVGLIQFK